MMMITVSFIGEVINTISHIFVVVVVVSDEVNISILI